MYSPNWAFFLESNLVRFVLVYSKKLFLIIFCISRHDGQISKKILKLAYLKEFCADNDGTLRFGVAPPESTLAGAEIDAGDKFVSGLPFLIICSTPTTTSVCQWTSKNCIKGIQLFSTDSQSTDCQFCQIFWKRLNKSVSNCNRLYACRPVD